jgi:glycosyl hydrolase family 42 (putative beta-galactosidase)
MPRSHRSSHRFAWGFCVFALVAAAADTDAPRTRAPFIYVLDYQQDQADDPDYRKNLDVIAPYLFHPGSDLRFAGRHAYGGSIAPSRSQDYETYIESTRAYTTFLRERGVKWITPYLGPQTIMGNHETREGAWALYDDWARYEALGWGPKPPDPITWMQREPDGALHYNYPRRWPMRYRSTPDHYDRYAVCPNNPHWRAFCRDEARRIAEVGCNGLFVDNCIIHCYCEHCEAAFQRHLRDRYAPDQLDEAFGTRDYTSLTLHDEGDAKRWARTFPEFLPWLEARVSDDERRILFNTEGRLESHHIDNAGGGALTGLTASFLHEYALAPGQRPTFENIRLANPALGTRVGHLRWAETTIFWCESMAAFLCDVRDAGREIDPSFVVIPNWGTMQRVNAAAGRAEDGHDLRRWRTAGSWHMFEEGYTTGQIAPGLILDYDMELRYAYACGVQAMLLPYHFSQDAFYEVAVAEAAGVGGSVYASCRFDAPPLAAYQRFFRDHADLYGDYESAARVGLLHSFDQVHYLNLEHLRQVHALNRFLADQQIPFDHVTEDQLDHTYLNRYRVLILPHVQYLDDNEVRQILGFIHDGGIAVAIGAFATHDRRARPRETTPLDAAPPTQVQRFARLDEVLPYDGLYLEPGVQAAQQDAFAHIITEGGGKYEQLARMDEHFWFKRYLDPGPITHVIEKALGHAPQLADPIQAAGIRSTIFKRHIEDGRSRITVHLVNKNVPLTGPHQGEGPDPVEALQLRIPVPDSAQEYTATTYFPDGSPRNAPVKRVDAQVVEVTLDHLQIYAVVSLSS